MEYTPEQLREQRKIQNSNMQNEYDKCNDYVSKLMYIYRTLITSQFEFLKYCKKSDIFGLEYLEKLVSELKSKENLNDLEFIKFIEKRLVKPLGAGHVYIKPVEEIAPSEVIALRERYYKENNIENIEVTYFEDTIIIKIKSFSRTHYKKDEEKFNEISEYMSKNECNNVIFDIRGNTGGTDEYFEYFSIFSNMPIQITDQFRNVFTNENQRVTWTAMNGNSNAAEFNRYLLVDKDVFSTADSFAMMCKRNAFATIIGEPTRGEGYGATPFNLQIVNQNYEYPVEKQGYQFQYRGANLVFPIEAPINEIGEIDYENYYRTIPDIICSSEEALQVALNQIELKKQQENSFNSPKNGF